MNDKGNEYKILSQLNNLHCCVNNLRTNYLSVTKQFPENNYFPKPKERMK